MSTDLRNNWHLDEIKEIYETPLLELVFRAAAYFIGLLFSAITSICSHHNTSYFEQAARCCSLVNNV